MKLINRIAVASAVLALGATPAVAAGGSPTGTPSAEQRSAAGNAGKVAAPGRYCKEQGLSNKGGRGRKGSAFSMCVRAQKELLSGRAANPAKACKAAGLSRKGRRGIKGSAFSACVKAVAQRLADEDEEAGFEDEEVVEQEDEFSEEDELDEEFEDEEDLDEDWLDEEWLDDSTSEDEGLEDEDTDA